MAAQLHATMQFLQHLQNLDRSGMKGEQQLQSQSARLHLPPQFAEEVASQGEALISWCLAFHAMGPFTKQLMP